MSETGAAQPSVPAPPQAAAGRIETPPMGGIDKSVITQRVDAKFEIAAAMALALSIVSVVIWIIPAVVALALCAPAKRNIAASNGYRHGNGLVLAARIVSICTLGGGIAAIGALIII